MVLIQFNQTWQVGVRQFDEEHQKLVSIINQLHNAVKAAKDTQSLKIILKELAIFALTHFDNEEALLEQHGYPELAQHRSAHKKLLLDLDKFNSEILTGTIATQYEMLQFLMDWLVEHTRDVDKRYGAFLNAAGIE